MKRQEKERANRRDKQNSPVDLSSFSRIFFFQGESRNFTTGENISFPLPLSYFSSDNFPSLVELDEDEKRTVPHLVAICPADVQLPFQNPKVSREGRESLLFLIILMRPVTFVEITIVFPPRIFLVLECLGVRKVKPPEFRW